MGEENDVKNDEKIAVIIPTITINGVIYQPSRAPKARQWRGIMEFYNNQMDYQAEEYMEKMAEVIALAFDREPVTADAILDMVPIDEMLDLLSNVYIWYGRLLNEKFETMQKNAAAAATN